MGNSDRVNETRQTKIVSDDANGKSGVGNYTSAGGRSASTPVLVDC